jgi:cytochrome P450
MEAQEVFIKLLEPAGIDNPYPLYATVHQLGEVIPAGDGLIPGGGQMMLVPAYEVANAVLRDPGYIVPDAAYLDEVRPGWRDHPSLDANNLLTLNGDDHSRIRTLITKHFTRRRVAELEPAVARLTDGLLDAMADQGADGSPVDFMQQFAFALPVTVICELIGVPVSLRGEFRPLARALALTLEPLVDAEAIAEADVAALKLADMFGELIAERRAAPADDLLSAIVQAADAEPGRITDAELIQNLILLLVAGFETTTNLLGNGVRLVLDEAAFGGGRKSELVAGLMGGEAAAAAFVEEVLRYDSPVQFASDRRPTSEKVVAGVNVTPDDHLVVMVGAANRDPKRFAEPDRFWPQRPDNGPLSFGGGAHFCVGAALARLEGTVAFPRLFGRFPALASAGQPERRSGIVLRGFEHLPVTVI